MNTLSLIHFHDVKLSCQPSASDGPRNDKKHPHAFLISSLKADRKSLYASNCPSSETGNNVGAGNVNVTGGGRFSCASNKDSWQGSSIRCWQTVPPCIIHLSERIMMHHICISNHPPPVACKWLRPPGSSESSVRSDDRRMPTKSHSAKFALNSVGALCTQCLMQMNDRSNVIIILSSWHVKNTRLAKTLKNNHVMQ